MMAMVISPSLSFCDLPGQNEQLYGCRSQINLPTKPQVHEALLYSPVWNFGSQTYNTASEPMIDFSPTLGFCSYPILSFTGTRNQQQDNVSPSRLDRKLQTHPQKTTRPRYPKPRMPRQKRVSERTKESHSPPEPVQVRTDISYVLENADNACHVAVENPTRLDETCGKETGHQDPNDTIRTSETTNRRPGSEMQIASFGDLLFSSTCSESNGAVPNLSGLCSVCRQPFEISENALAEHVTQHARDIAQGFSCAECHAKFMFKADLDWHLLRGHQCFANSVRHIEWEQTQLKWHTREVDFMVSREPQPRRSSSVPPRRKPLELYCGSPNTSCNEDNRSSPETVSNDTGKQSIDICTSIKDLQSRVKNLTDLVCPSTNSPANSQLLSSQNSPDSDWSDSISLPAGATPFTTFEDAEPVKRPQSAPPSPRQAAIAGCWPSSGADAGRRSHANGSSAETGRNSQYSDLGNYTSPFGENRKRRNDDTGQNCDENGGEAERHLTSKRRKFMTASNGDGDNRFPCIFHIGEPQQFAKDVVKHKHISNMCRHFKSHRFHVCPTCIIQFPSAEDLESHHGHHISNCQEKGCKRTRPAQSSIVGSCEHILSPEDQWKALYMLKYGRPPPLDVFAPSPSMAPPAVNFTESNLPNNPIIPILPSATIGQQAGSFNYSGPFEPHHSAMNVNSEFDLDEFLNMSAETEPGFCFQSMEQETHVTQPKAPSTAEEPSLSSLVASLSQQVTSLERKLESDSKDRDDKNFSLQRRNAELEQKLFQSSEREKQLEAALEVIFDAFRATGAPQAQPGLPLWKLAMSHSARATASQPAEERVHGYGIPTPGGESMSRADSAYGSSK